MTIYDVSKLLPVCHEVNDAILISGEAGLGKSHIVKEYAEINGYHIEDLRLGNQEIGDLIGMPEVKEGVTVWTEPIWLNRLNKAANNGKKCVLFLDELNRAQQDVKASALQIVLDRSIHQHKLPEGTLIAAAINPERSDDGQEYQVDELDPALLDRFLQVKVSSDSTSWLNWARNNKVNPVIIGFISENPKFLYNIPKNGSRIATPRSWTSLSKYVDIFDKIQDNQKLDIVSGKIGPEIAVRFITYFNEHNKKISADDIIDLVNEHKDKKPRELEQTIKDFIASKNLEELAVRELLNQVYDRTKKHFPKPDSELTDKQVEKLRPLLAIAYSMNLEALSAFIMNLKETENANFLRLAEVDLRTHGEKSLYMRLLATR